jgi:opine dehydrogenase
MATRVAVLGAGNGGCAAAADLTRRGFSVALHSRSRARLQPLLERGGLESAGAIGEGFVRIDTVTDDLATAVRDAEILVITVPSTGHEYYARALAPLLRPEQDILINPGHTGGGLHVVQALRAAGYRGPVRVGETATLTYSTRLVGPARVMVYHVATDLLFAAFPGKHRDALLARFRPLYPALTPAANVLQTALLNINAIEHPPQILLNAGWIEHTRGDFLFYYEGTTPSVARVIERVDAERLGIVRALGLPEVTFLEYFSRSGYTTEEGWRSGSVYVAMQQSEPNKAMRAPQSLDHRYVHEDVGYGLVPFVAFAELVGVPVPLMRSLVEVANALMGLDYWQIGRNLQKMGLAGVPRADLERFLYEGV